MEEVMFSNPENQWKTDLKKYQNEKPVDELPQDVLGGQMRNLKGMVNVGTRNKALFRDNQDKFKGYYEMTGQPTNSKEEYTRITRRHLVKRQETPKNT